MVDISGQVVIDNRQRGSLSAGYGVYARQGYEPYRTDVAAGFRDLAQRDPDFITRNAERFDRNANSSVSFLRDGNFVAQYSMVNGRYSLSSVYDQNDPRLAQARDRLVVEQQNMDPLRRAQIDARHSFEDLSMNNPGVLAHDAHVYPNSVNYGQGEAYMVQNVGGRDYGAKYGFINGRFEMRQLFDLQDPQQGRAFEQQEVAAANREAARDRAGMRQGGYGVIPTPYPGRGGTEVGVVIDNGRRGTDVGVRVGDRGVGVGVDIDAGRRGTGGRVDVSVPGVGRFDIGVFKPPHR